MFANIINPFKRLVWSPFQRYIGSEHNQQQQEIEGGTSEESPGEEGEMVQTRRKSEGELASSEIKSSQLKNGASKKRVISEGSIPKKRRRVGDGEKESLGEPTPMELVTGETPGSDARKTEIPSSQATREGIREEKAVEKRKKRVMVAVVVEKTRTPPGKYVDFPDAVEKIESDQDGDDKNSKNEVEWQESNSIHYKKSSGSAGPSVKMNGRGAHTRFGDDDLQINSSSQEQPRQLSLPIGEEASKEQQSDSGDEAPEAVHLSTAQRSVTARQREAAKAAQSQAAALRQKRRDRDQRLKDQAQLHQKKQQESVPETPPFVLESEPEAGDSASMNQTSSRYGNQKPRRKPELPELLPEEILAAEPYRPMPPGPLQEAENQLQTSKKHILFGAEEKPAKDVQRGPVKVRVLEQRNPVLAPRASKSGKSVREQWLTGRVKAGGVAAVERRKPNGGFVRS
ncbi:MAG: hypothetical protein M1823_002684 [Watsoniomyces obsoletus]|nr:MAG: hypothetical protein M1823_002684 [Watsoniomyces obsoletus]